MTSHSLARSWTIVFLTAAGLSLLVLIAEHEKVTAEYFVWAVATGLVLASGIVLGGSWLKGKTNRTRAFWIGALLIVVAAAFAGARLA